MLFRKDIERHCAYCIHAGIVDANTLICTRRGIVSAESACRHFDYDPLKRIPAKKKALDAAKYEKKDFSL